MILYILFLLSGFSGLVYQVTWVRGFGNIFGNTIHAASIVVAVFMLGLGVGSLWFGRWADRHYLRRQSFLRTYGYVELAIAALGVLVSLALPHLGGLAARVSSYSIAEGGWHVLTTSSHVWLLAIAIALLMPITILMGGTLTLLIRHVVKSDLDAGNRRVALLFAVNTAGAALGALITDFALVPEVGLNGAQWVAAILNILAGAGAIALDVGSRPAAAPTAAAARRRPETSGADRSVSRSPLAWMSAALFLTGFVGMGAEIVWFRHISLLLGGFRAVFSLLLAVVLASIGLGAFVAGTVRWARARPIGALLVIEALFVSSLLAGLAAADLQQVRAAEGLTNELWLNARPIILEVGLPALFMGFSFPLANAAIQRVEATVAHRAGVLYIANTAGAVVGALAAGFVLLPRLGLQQSATVLAAAALLSMAPLALAARERDARPGHGRSNAWLPAVISLAAGIMAVVMWLQLPSGAIVSQAQAPPQPGERILAQSEGISEIVRVLDTGAEGLQLLTNGHPMSSTSFMSQRYMRAFAHIPLLAMEQPSRVLVIGFGVGNTTHAASLHPTVTHIDVADLSRHVLEQATYFRDANKDVLADPRVSVYVNDGRHHLRMQPPASYDLITLEPPPLAFAGVASLYSKEFYELARARLTAQGYVSQWLPAYQVSDATRLAVIRSFVDVFPQSVLLSGAGEELLLIGTAGEAITIDPEAVAVKLRAAPAVEADLRRLSLVTPRDLVGTFVAGPRKLLAITRAAAPLTDDHPVLEYDTRSRASDTYANPVALLSDTGDVRGWCPSCFTDGRSLVDGLDRYLTVLNRLYSGETPQQLQGVLAEPDAVRVVSESEYLAALLPDGDTVIGVTLASKGQFADAITAFRRAVDRRPDSSRAHWNLGGALVAQGVVDEGVRHLRDAVRLDPANAQAQFDLGTTLLESGKMADAIAPLSAAVRLSPGWTEARNNVGIALASTGRFDEAIAAFEEVIRQRPDFASARRNLQNARENQRRGR